MLRADNTMWKNMKPKKPKSQKLKAKATSSNIAAKLKKFEYIQ